MFHVSFFMNETLTSFNNAPHIQLGTQPRSFYEAALHTFIQSVIIMIEKETVMTRFGNLRFCIYLHIFHIHQPLYQVRTTAMSDFRVYIINEKTKTKTLFQWKPLIINIVSIAP